MRTGVSELHFFPLARPTGKGVASSLHSKTNPHFLATPRVTIDNSHAVKNFCRFFKEHPPTFAKAPDATTMTVGGRRFHYDDLNSLDKLFDAAKVINYDLVDWFKAPPEEKVSWFVNFVETSFRAGAVQLRENKKELREKLKQNGKSDLALPDADYILTHLQSFRFLGDFRKEAGFRFWDTKTKSVTEYDYHSIRSALISAGVDKDTIEQFLHQILHANEVYDPHGNYGMTLIPDSNAVYKINQYVRPIWRDLMVDPALPEEIDQLMRHLFPKEECREFVYTWIYHSLTTRSGTYLYLCGGQATGKNTLASVIAALHGSHNVSRPKQDTLHGRFNQYLKNKRFVFFDEFNCRSRQDKDTLKRIINDRIQIEGKHTNHEDIDIHASYMIANNSLEAIGIDPVDRRFSVPDVTHEAILPKCGPDFITGLLERLKDDAYVAAFGNWVLETFRKDRKWAPETPYQRVRFEEIVFATARAGIAEVLAKVLKKEQREYEYSEEKESFRRAHKGTHYPTLLDWQKYLTDLKRDGKPLGKVEGTKFIPRDEFLREAHD